MEKWSFYISKLCDNLDWTGLLVCIVNRLLTILAFGYLAMAGIHICYGPAE
jgi:hypothetical protein